LKVNRQYILRIIVLEINRSPMNKTVMPGQGCCLGSIVHMELVEDGADAFGQEKLLGDTGFCETAGEKLQDSKFPFGQFRP
jgi:hypothetical protein